MFPFRTTEARTQNRGRRSVATPGPFKPSRPGHRRRPVAADTSLDPDKLLYRPRHRADVDPRAVR